MSDDDNLLASLDGVAYFTSDAEADGVQAVQKTAAANEASALRSFMTCGGVIVGRLYAPHVAAYLRRATTTIVV